MYRAHLEVLKMIESVFCENVIESETNLLVKILIDHEKSFKVFYARSTYPMLH